MGNDRALDGAPRVNIEIPRRTIKTFGAGDNKVHVVTRNGGLVSYEAGACPEVLSTLKAAPHPSPLPEGEGAD
ncbi:hypothetical protein FGA82_30680 [Pseudomonas fluorescens]|nr:hypothetical protein FGA82_30680 [Pseudomonas fluorescens]